MTRDTRTAVVSVGGNALSPEGEPASIENQFRHTRESLVPIVDFVCRGWRVAVVHGNGPQVGDALVRNECARGRVSELPLGVLVASTAGWIGYMMQQSLQNALRREGADRPVATLVTQVVVDRTEPEAMAPRKFIGRAVSREVAAELEEEGASLGRDGRGNLRRRVASPRPVRIVEAPLVRRLVADGCVVIAAGGGGTPVYEDAAGALEGLDVVVDKDLAASLLAREIRASTLLSLTDVDGVYEGWGGPEARRIERLTASEARAFLEAGEAGEGSMRPKLAAAVRFVEEGGERARIAALEEAAAAMRGEAGTAIVPDRA
ncbi:MAG: carbamate kinase [Gemmatimonadota bacterium]|nr:carbamate kinase [Gemmatimonadota bacterium]